ncbi:MAG: hypothetical protein HRT64_10170 [Erythrobacter sp.]|nr:hypothetical protein [Erythrobacter sp.]
MNSLQAFFDSGYAADVVLAVLVIEGLWLASRGWSVSRIAFALGPAVFIVLAVRAALVGAGWYWIALALAASFPLHVLDIRSRLDR